MLKSILNVFEREKSPGVVILICCCSAAVNVSFAGVKALVTKAKVIIGAMYLKLSFFVIIYVLFIVITIFKP